MNEAGGSALDAYGSNNLTENGGTIPGDTGLSYSTARDLESGSSQYFSCASNTSLQATTSFTLAGAFKLESQPSGGVSLVVVGKDVNTPANSRDYVVDIFDASSDQFRFYVNGGGAGLSAAIGGDLTLGQWYTWRAWWDYAAPTVNVQLGRGTPVTAVTGGTPVQTSDAEFRIGARAYSGFNGNFDGVIGPVAMWKRVLTTNEWMWLENNGKFRQLSEFYTPAGSRIMSRSGMSGGMYDMTGGIRG